MPAEFDNDPGAPPHGASVAGADGAPAGWVLVTWTPAGLDARLVRQAHELIAVPVDQIAVDMPIGIPDRGARACDVAARRLLPRGRKSSVFAPPRRYMLGRSYADATAAGTACEGKGISKQAWHLGQRIAALDACLAPADQARVAESHPELVFHRLNAWAPVPKKTTAEGRDARLAMLVAAGLPDPAPLLSRFPRREVASADVLDAVACALTARRRLAGSVERVPDADPMPRDARGLQMGIWY
jgi:predicted RNase H-like nuclease